MAITCRRYKDIKDYNLICTFLEKSFTYYGTRFDNNLTLFEFQCALSCGLAEPVKSIDVALEKVFLWFDNEELVAFLDEECFCIAPNYRFIFDQLLNVAEDNYLDEEGTVLINVYEDDKDFEGILLNKGYLKTDEYWVRREFDLTKSLETIDLPDGFYFELVPDIKNQDEVYNAYKLCYGIPFNNNVFENFYKTSTYRKELDLVVIGPNKNVVALCSGRYDEKNKLVTIEAVACYQDYRRKGITKALLLHVLRISKKLGATKATVYTAMPEKYPAPNMLYEAVGFNSAKKIYVWRKNKS